MSSGAGEFNRYVAFEVKTVTQDRSGQSVETWATDFNEWVAAEPVGTREFPIAFKRHAETSMRFRMRYRSPQPSSATHRVNFDGRYWDIHGVSEVEYHRELHVEASEII